MTHFSVHCLFCLKIFRICSPEFECGLFPRARGQHGDICYGSRRSEKCVGKIGSQLSQRLNYKITQSLKKGKM